MILTCPSCTMRYLVAEGAIGPNGRRIKCAHCGHQWFEDGEEGLDEALFDLHETVASSEPAQEEVLPDGAIQFQESIIEEEKDEFPDFQAILQKQMEAAQPSSEKEIPEIPEGVRPIPEAHSDIVIPAKRGLKLPGMDARMSGFATAALIFLITVSVLLIMQPQISRAWPPSNMLYGLVGLSPALPGEGLSLSNLQAKFEGGNVTLSGDINNLKSEALDVPSVVASFVGANDEILVQILIPPPINRIKGEGHVSFNHVYADVPAEATNVTFAFSYIKAKTEETAESQR